MKTMIYAAGILAVLLVGLGACQSKSKPGEQAPYANAIDTIHTSKNCLDWGGSYTGIIPCADCGGIRVRLTLNADETYALQYQYLGKGDDKVSSTSGRFTWKADGSTIVLDSGDYPPYYAVGERFLIQLDRDGNRITGELADKYVLAKTS
ncbi:MAG: copper resistance protein NlpE [Dysgonamonadaceae bacterium]|jgi:uncharacterized lipoprotein NlpE involved in copper resistance|nr:copper resistance protein NlpE [Dysgonamonadaceae bacterium]